MRKTLAVSLVSIVILLAFSSWGVTGHRTIGRIAENHLTPKAKASIQALLGSESLADVSVWADQVRSTPEFKHTGAWHYINFPLGLTYDEFAQGIETKQEDNIYKAMIKCVKQLMNAQSSKQEKINALKFIVHFVGDLHQPMHVSRAEDQGGNTIQVNFEGKGTNLHSLWDSKLIEKTGLTDIELSKKYDTATPQEVAELQSATLMEELWESYQISSELYKEIEALPKKSIGEEYYEDHLIVVEDRIATAGIRLAGVLNEAFKYSGSGASSSRSSAPRVASVNDTTICEKVFDSVYIPASQSTFLTMGGKYPNEKFTAVIRGTADHNKFPGRPAMIYKDKTLCITGTVQLYEGRKQMLVTEPGQITVK